jgi:hypothetical protein
MPPDPFTALALEWLALWDPRSLRQRWLADMSRVVGRSMRSAAFLEMIRLNLTAMTRSAGLASMFFRR